MKTTVLLDFQAILANRAQPVYLALEFTAPGQYYTMQPMFFRSSPSWTEIVETLAQLEAQINAGLARRCPTRQDRLFPSVPHSAAGTRNGAGGQLLP